MVGRVNGGLLLLLLLVCVPPALDELLDEELPHSALGKDVDFCHRRRRHHRVPVEVLEGLLCVQGAAEKEIHGYPVMF